MQGPRQNVERQSMAQIVRIANITHPAQEGKRKQPVQYTMKKQGIKRKAKDTDEQNRGGNREHWRLAQATRIVRHGSDPYPCHTRNSNCNRHELSPEAKVRSDIETRCEFPE